MSEIKYDADGRPLPFDAFTAELDAIYLELEPLTCRLRETHQRYGIPIDLSVNIIHSMLGVGAYIRRVK